MKDHRLYAKVNVNGSVTSPGEQLAPVTDVGIESAASDDS